jgi:hypothetical protein
MVNDLEAAEGEALERLLQGTQSLIDGNESKADEMPAGTVDARSLGFLEPVAVEVELQPYEREVLIDKAHAVLVEIMEDKSAPAADRIKAAGTVLEFNKPKPSIDINAKVTGYDTLLKAVLEENKELVQQKRLELRDGNDFEVIE